VALAPAQSVRLQKVWRLTWFLQKFYGLGGGLALPIAGYVKLYQVAFSRTQLGIKAAGTDARKFLKMLGFPAFSKTLA
jgi:hypothetical protein